MKVVTPPTHGAHEWFPDNAFNELRAQGVHGIPTDSTVYPATHTQAKLAIPESILTGQEVQLSDPTAPLKVPAPQVLHGDPGDSAVYPATQPQSKSATADTVELILAGQEVQLPDPTALLNVPSKHELHGPASAPVKPNVHLQSVTAVLTDADVVDTGQVAQLFGVDSYLSVAHAHTPCGTSSVKSGTLQIHVSNASCRISKGKKGSGSGPIGTFVVSHTHTPP